MKTKLIVLLTALLAASSQAGEHPSCKFTVKVTGTDTGRITYNQDGDVLPLVDGVEAVVWDHQKVSLGGGGCVTGTEPVVTFTAYVWAMAQSTPGWCKVDDDSYTLYVGCEGLTVYSVQTCSEELIQVRLEVDNVYCPCRSVPAFAPNGGNNPDWTIHESENFPGNFEVGVGSYFNGTPRLHVQAIANTTGAPDFDDIGNYCCTYDYVFAPDEGPYDTGLVDSVQTYTRARFEDALGNALTDWSAVTQL